MSIANGAAARLYHTAQVHYFRKKLDVSNAGFAIEVGELPIDAIVLRSTVIVKTAFVSGGANTIDIGTEDNATAFGAALDASVVGAVSGVIAPADAVLVAGQKLVVTANAAAATAGEAFVVVEYAPAI